MAIPTPAEMKFATKPKDNAEKTLAMKGKVKVKATVGFTPQGGAAFSGAKSITLRKRPVA